MPVNFGKYNPNLSTYENRYQVYVMWVDHARTVDDLMQEGSIESISPQTGRNLHLGGIKLGGIATGLINNILVPQDVLGSFRVPQVGDVVWVEESRRSNDNTPIYMFSSYSYNTKAGTPVPEWGGMPGDYGHLRSYKDHAAQFLTTTPNADFRTKYMASVTGHRFRQFYLTSLDQGKYVLRGDPVFDIDPGEVSKEYIIGEGNHILEGGNLEDDKGKYPEPLNAPKEREKDIAYTYANVIYSPVPVSLSADSYDTTPKTSVTPIRVMKSVLKTKNYTSYQPILDREFLEKSKFEREIPAAEEYQVALRGNNKLLIQDQYGDGEQLVITLKNQYDAQFTIIHNADRGQVRIRDHMGQGVLLDADPEAPRVVTWTANKQVIEQGSVKDVGEFTYIRNGGAFGDSQTSFGTKTGKTKDTVPNQEFLMVSTPDIIGELSSRLSSGMNSLVSGAMSPGIYFRNNTDPDAKSQSYSLYTQDTTLVADISQELSGMDGMVETSNFQHRLTGSGVTQTVILDHVAPEDHYTYTETTTVTGQSIEKSSSVAKVGSDTITTLETINGDNTALTIRSTKAQNNNEIVTTEDTSVPMARTELKVAGDTFSAIEQTDSSLVVRRQNGGLSMPITIGNDGGTGVITIGTPSSNLSVLGNIVNVSGDTSVDVSGGTVGVAGATSVTISSPSVNVAETLPPDDDGGP